jgi:glycosyltransferase 2 family protein
MWRGFARTALKALASIGLLALALRGIDTVAIRTHLADADPWTIAVAIALMTGISAMQAERWRIVLNCLGRDLHFVLAWKLVLIGYFFNQTLPSTVGGDAFRVWGAYRNGIRVGDAISSVIIDRVAALTSLLLMIVLGLPWLFELITIASARWIVMLVLVGGMLGMVLLLSLGRFASLLGRWRPTRLLLPVATGARAVFGSGTATTQIVLLTIVGYAIASYAVHLLAQGLAIRLGFGDALLLIPLVTLVTVLPVSIAGWGLRESAMVVALGLIGVPAAAAFSLSVLYGLVVMASGVPGGVIWLMMRRVAPAMASTEVGPYSHE